MAASSTFESRFGGAAEGRAVAPGRVNLIGEHTDYNDGFVLPMAIDRSTQITFRRRDDRQVVLYSNEFGQEARFDLDGLRRDGNHWSEYPKGVAWALREGGARAGGWEGVVDSDVPIGAGLSSSASFELAVARVFAEIGGLPWDPAAMARVGRACETDWVGVQVGIMDQMISACGVADHAVLLDCRSLETRPVPLPPGTLVAILDTGTRRGLVDSAYNERREQCEAAAASMGVAALRDANEDMLHAASGMGPVVFRRARHVITENRRTLEAVRAMEEGNAAGMGALMNQSHASLRDDFEVSSDALNAMVNIARRQPGCHGARMTGAGFGGCAVALVAEARAGDFLEEVTTGYREATGHEPALYGCRASAGAHVQPI